MSGVSRLAVVLPLIAAAAAGLWLWAGRNGGASAQSGGADRVKSTLHLETFVLNIGAADQRSYLRIGIELGLNRELKRDEPAPVAAVRDTILTTLADAKADELLTAAGKAGLKEKLLRALQGRVPALGVTEVYFTEFLIQR